MFRPAQYGAKWCSEMAAMFRGRPLWAKSFFLCLSSPHRFSVFHKYFLPVLYTSVLWQVFLSVYSLYFFIETVQRCERANVQLSKSTECGTRLKPGFVFVLLRDWFSSVWFNLWPIRCASRFLRLQCESKPFDSDRWFVYWPITIKFKTREQNSKPQTKLLLLYLYLRFSYREALWPYG